MRKLTVTDSSNVQSIAHDSHANTLTVEFASGACYQYANCTIDDFATACHAPSIGSWVHEALVKDLKRHPVQRLSPPSATGPSPHDLHRVTLQAMASIRPGAAVTVEQLVSLARSALEGRTPPPVPDGYERPIAKTEDNPHRTRFGEKLVVWPHMDEADPRMTPDEAEGLAFALLAAALEARS